MAKKNVVNMRILRQMSGKLLFDRMRNGYKKFDEALVENKTRKNQLRWIEHV